jgi:hypothetical protein
LAQLVTTWQAWHGLAQLGTAWHSLALSICDIGNITYRLTMAKYLPILSRGDTVQ